MVYKTKTTNLTDMQANGYTEIGVFSITSKEFKRLLLDAAEDTKNHLYLSQLDEKVFRLFKKYREIA